MCRHESMNRLQASVCVLVALVVQTVSLAEEGAKTKDGARLFSMDNLVAWCIVPFDAKKRGPEERAEMLHRLGFQRFAYDWRAKHIPTFDQEMEALKKRGVKLQAFWFPSDVEHPHAQTILDLLKRHGIKTELWTSMGSGGPARTQAEQDKKVQVAVRRIKPIAERAAKMGCKVGLYNHGGWFGEPANQIAVIKRLGLPNVGIVYNLHHGHSHLDRFDALLEEMLPYLLAVNLNGMVRDGDKRGKKIVPIGQGRLDLELLRAIRDSGYRGPIGILGHRADQDAEVVLKANLDGLRQLAGKLGDRSGVRSRAGK